MITILGSIWPEILNWLPFFGGQWLFLLRRTALAIRSPLNAVKSRRQYLRENWDILLVRTVLEFILIYFPYRHSNLFEQYAPKWLYLIPTSWVMTLFLGFISDALMDSIGSRDKVFGIPVPSIIKETIPQLPQVTQLVAHLESKGTM